MDDVTFDTSWGSSVEVKLEGWNRTVRVRREPARSFERRLKRAVRQLRREKTRFRRAHAFTEEVVKRLQP